MYIAMRRYEGLDARAYQQIAGRRSAELVDCICQLPTFVAHYAALDHDGSLLGMSIFMDRASAEESNRRALDWVRENWTDVVPNLPTVSLAEVVSNRDGEGFAAPWQRPQVASTVAVD